MLKRLQPIILLFAFMFLASAVEASSAMITSKIQVDGMVCGGCERALKSKLEALEGIQSIQASHEKKEVVARYLPTKVQLSQIISAIQKMGYDAVAGE